MITLVIVGRCARDKSREAALNHMRRVHGPMVYAPPPDAGPMPSAYAQNYVFDDEGALPAQWRGAHDFVTQVGFDDFAHLRAATSTPYYLDRLRPDEANFVDMASVRVACTRRVNASGAPGAAQVMMFFKFRGEAPAPPDDNTIIGRASEIVLSPLDGGPAPFDRIERLGFADRAAARNFVRRRFPAYAEALAPHVEQAHSFTLLADHYSEERLKGGAP